MSEQAKRLVAREQVLAYVLCALFVGFFVAAEVLGGKLFRFTLFGLGPDDLGLGDGAEFAATAGILAFPLTFVMTDIVNEYYGRPIVKLFTWIAIAVNLLLQPVIRAAIDLPHAWQLDDFELVIMLASTHAAGLPAEITIPRKRMTVTVPGSPIRNWRRTLIPGSYLALVPAANYTQPFEVEPWTRSIAIVVPPP